ncbi:hypothetical protein [Halapricum desulfuricans]|uniref:Uncharacterized protein n=1 Tax=Halapricum desulfuricans TaxID=2841257 RepID=A0A897ND51_9EURY|nr:hypothetical protein [Halapricum desulfuricans]QSG10311.1 hypothetical protein HSR122_2941 [Halapricum desulfuricans]
MKTLATAFETLIDGHVESEPRSAVGPQWHGGHSVFDGLDVPSDLDLEYGMTVREPGRAARLVRPDGGTGQ